MGRGGCSVFHVGAGDRAALARAADPRRIHPKLVCQMPDRGRNRHRCCGSAFRLCGRARCLGRFRTRLGLGACRPRACLTGAVVGGLGNQCQGSADGHRAANIHQEFGHHALFEGLHIHNGLVRVHNGHHIAAVHEVSRLDQPLHHLAVLHVRAKGGHPEFTHGSLPPPGQQPRCVRPREVLPVPGVWRRAAALRRYRRGPRGRPGRRRHFR
jgi:hypothetical protein